MHEQTLGVADVEWDRLLEDAASTLFASRTAAVERSPCTHPIITTIFITSLFNSSHLGAHVIRRPNHSLGALERVLQHPRNAKVAQPHQIVGSQKHILRLEIAMQHSSLVDVSDRQGQLRQPIQDLPLLEVDFRLLRGFDAAGKVAAIAVLQHGVVTVWYNWMHDRRQAGASDGNRHSRTSVGVCSPPKRSVSKRTCIKMCKIPSWMKLSL